MRPSPKDLRIALLVSVLAGTGVSALATLAGVPYTGVIAGLVAGVVAVLVLAKRSKESSPPSDGTPGDGT